MESVKNRLFMKIAVNTRFLIKDKLEGIGVYTLELFKRTVELLPEHEFYFLFDRKPADEFIFAKNVTTLVVSPPARHPLLWFWWFEIAIPKTLKKYSIDLFISPDGFCSLNTDIPQIMTIHDLGFEHYKKHTPFLVKNYYTYFVPKYCRKAVKILTVSEFTKQDIITQYGIDENKIAVIYNGFDKTQTKSENTLTDIDNRISENIPYFIFIGAVHPRKNVLGLLKAFEYFKTNYSHPHQLVIIGRNAWLNKDVESCLQTMKYKSDVIWIEEVTRENLLKLLHAAFSLVYPSFFEGFGIPILEAMHLGVPVICSSASAMPEIADDAGILINPENTTAIAEAMQLLITHDEVRKNKIALGLKRAEKFSWEKSAQKLADLILTFKKM